MRPQGRSLRGRGPAADDGDVVRRPNRPIRRRRPDPLAAAGGFLCLCLRNVTTLYASARGERRYFPRLRDAAGRLLSWEYWFPHLGILIDRRTLPEAEHEQRLTWATEQGLLYFCPPIDEDALRLAMSRRQQLAAIPREPSGVAAEAV